MLMIISGAQTGVDRGALNAALALNVPCGGWCPDDRCAEDGIIADRYPVRPLRGAGYRQRTRQNVMDSDATVMVYQHEIALGSGTELTLKTCISQRKPYLLIDAACTAVEVAGHNIVAFVQRHNITRLNFGGPRASLAPNIETYTEQIVRHALNEWQSMCRQPALF